MPLCSNSRYGKSALDGCEQVLLTFYSACHYANFVPKYQQIQKNKIPEFMEIVREIKEEIEHPPAEQDDKNKDCDSKANFANCRSETVQACLQEISNANYFDVYFLTSSKNAGTWQRIGKATKIPDPMSCSNSFIPTWLPTCSGVSSSLSSLMVAISFPHSVAIPTAVTCNFL